MLNKRENMMKKNKIAPLDFMIANRQVIIKSVDKTQSLQFAWELLLKELPKIEEVIKFNTFKSNIKATLLINKELEEKEFLKKELQQYKNANKKLNNDKESLLKQLKIISSEKNLLEENAINNKKQVNKDKSRNRQEAPQQFEGWGVQLKEPYYRLFKKINGKVKWIHIGRKWDQELAHTKIYDFALKSS